MTTAGQLFDGLSGSVAVSDAPSLDDITIPGGHDLACETCGAELTYGGRGRKPRFCDEHKPNRTRTTATKPRGRRGKKQASPHIEALLGMGYAMGGMRLSLTSQSASGIAAGRVMQLQAPDAGQRLARLLQPFIEKLTFLDKIQQGGPAGDIAAIVMPPLLVGFLAGNPAAFEALKPVVGMILTPMAKNIMAASEAQAEAMTKLTAPDEDTQAAVQEVLDNVFGGLFKTEGDSDSEEN